MNFNPINNYLINLKFYLTLAAFSLILLSSCNKAQSKIDEIDADISYLEDTQDEVTKQDWLDLGNKMYDLENDLIINRDDYSKEQIKEIRNLEGRLATLLVKESTDGIIDSILDINNQFESFLEGVKSSN